MGQGRCGNSTIPCFWRAPFADAPRSPSAGVGAVSMPIGARSGFVGLPTPPEADFEWTIGRAGRAHPFQCSDLALGREEIAHADGCARAVGRSISFSLSDESAAQASRKVIDRSHSQCPQCPWSVTFHEHLKTSSLAMQNLPVQQSKLFLA